MHSKEPMGHVLTQTFLGMRSKSSSVTFLIFIVRSEKSAENGAERDAISNNVPKELD